MRYSTLRRPIAALGAVALGTALLGSCKPVVIAAACDAALIAEVTGTVAAPELNEISGLASSRRQSGVRWAHNDSGDGPNLYALDSSGALVHTYTLSGATATDWEALSTGPGPAPWTQYLYVGDIGDNAAVRSRITLYRVPEPTVSGGGATAVTDFDTLHLVYPDGAHDAEALVVDPVYGDIVIVTKNLAGGSVGVYRAPPGLADGSETTLSLVGTVDPGAGLLNAVTAADVTGFGEAVIVRTYGSVLLWHRPAGAPLWDAFTTASCTGLVTPELQGEAVAFDADGLGYTTISEGSNPAVNHFLAPGDTTIEMEPDLAGGFFAMPWPADHRTTTAGTLDLTGYPGSHNPLAAFVLAAGAAVTTGFGTNSAAFFQTSGAIDESTLPDPDESVSPASSALIVDLDDPAFAPAPTLTDFEPVATDFRPANLLSLLPYPGHPLEQDTRHAAIVFNAVRDETGHPLERSPLLDELDEPWDSGKPVDEATWNLLRDQRDEVFAYVDAHTVWNPTQVVAFSVFTTQAVTTEMEAIAAAVEALPAPVPASRTAGTCSGPSGRTTSSGTLTLPTWQAGTRPYTTTGSGGIVVAPDGRAVQQATETVVFKITFPCGPPPSAAGWPILLFMDGTGAYADSANITELGATSSNPLPYVVASIAPMYSGDRKVTGYPGETLFFNYLNPLAARTNQLQQAADMLYLRRVLEGILLSAAETAHSEPIPSADDVVVIAGHSQGALTIPHALAVDSSFDGAFISAGGGGFYQSLLHRGDTRAMIDALLGTAPGELDDFHPVVHAMQTVAEIGDAVNYGSGTADIVNVSGLDDGCSPLEVTTMLGTALGLQVANPLIHPVFGSASFEPSTATLPATGNLGGTRTGVTVQMDTGHFGATTNPAVGRSFVDSIAAGGDPPTEAPGSIAADSNTGCAGRYGPLPGS